MIGLAFTKEQFKTLLRAVFVANYIANARDDGMVRYPAYEELEQYLFSRAKEAGFPDDAIRHETEGGGAHYHPSRAFEFDHEVDRILEEYENDIFWDELSDRLAERDLERKYGPGAKGRIPPELYREELEELSRRYDEECHRHGLDRFSLPER